MAEEAAAIPVGRCCTPGCSLQLLCWGVFDGYGVIYDKRTAIVMDVIQLVGDILR
jgi:hypothetical protein